MFKIIQKGFIGSLEKYRLQSKSIPSKDWNKIWAEEKHKEKNLWIEILYTHLEVLDDPSGRVSC